MPGPYSYAESGGFADRFQAIDRRLAALERSTRGAISGDGATTFLNAGDFIVRNDGSVVLLEADGDQRAVLSPTGLRLNDGAGTKLLDLTNLGLQAYEADGSVLSILDGSKLRFNRSDGTRALEITPAGGQKIYATDGTTEKVVLDSTGVRTFTLAGSKSFDSADAFRGWAAPDSTAVASSTSTTWVTVARFYSPFSPDAAGDVAIPVSVQASTDGTEGDLRIIQTSANELDTVLATHAGVIGFGATGSLYVYDAVANTLVDAGSAMWSVITVELRRSAGTGSVSAQCFRLAGFR